MSGYEEFNKKSEEFIKKIVSQNPLVILRFGSSIRPKDFIPGVSDLDMVVVSPQPIKDTENELGFEYFFNHPQAFVDGLVRGNPFILNAVKNGEVVYDPNDFMGDLEKRLDEAGIQPGPAELTYDFMLQSIGNQLSSAMNRYFADDAASDKTKLLRNVHGAIRSVGSIYAMQLTGNLPDGYSDILDKVKNEESEIAQLLLDTRQQLLERDKISDERKGKVTISDSDDLGSAILAVEKAYIDKVDMVPAKMATNSLVENYQKQNGPLTSTNAIMIDNGRHHHHLVLGKGEHIGHLFGILGTDSKEGATLHTRKVGKEDFEEFYHKLRMLR